MIDRALNSASGGRSLRTDGRLSTGAPWDRNTVQHTLEGDVVSVTRIGRLDIRAL